MTDLPAIQPDKTYGLPAGAIAPGLAIMFNDALFDRCKQIAGYMAKADGFTPPHLVGKSEACFAVVTRAITWRLDPFAVMQSTYQTPGGRVGYEAKLVQAILENSGQIEGNVRFELFGDWSRVRGKFKMVKGDRGKDYPVPAWKTPEDEEGLGVIVRAKVRGEEHLREMDLLLATCWPRNSTLWALRPEQQIKYTAARAFAHVVAPGIFMGVPFDADADQGMIDVTPTEPARPRQTLAAFPATATAAGETADARTPSQAYMMGVAARRAGVGYRNVPGYLSALDADDWMRAWQEEDRRLHGAGENAAASSSVEKQAPDLSPEPDRRQSIDAPAAYLPEPAPDLRQVAFEEGEAARVAGKSLHSAPADVKADPVRLDAWQDGWRAKDAELMEAAAR
jgi:hypothetical protein